MRKPAVQMLAECALMLALATLLSFIKITWLSFGGSVTLGSMVPLLYVAFRHPVKWALLTALAYALLQMLFGFYPPPAQTILQFAAVILLDYLLAFGGAGLAGLVAKPLGGMPGMLAGTSAALLFRFLCHFVSGIVIWGVYAPEGQSVAMYSFLYNGSYMLGEWIVSMVAIVAVGRVLSKAK